MITTCLIVNRHDVSISLVHPTTHSSGSHSTLLIECLAPEKEIVFKATEPEAVSIRKKLTRASDANRLKAISRTVSHYSETVHACADWDWWWEVEDSANANAGGKRSGQSAGRGFPLVHLTTISSFVRPLPHAQ